MGFIVKCAVCIGVVCALLLWRPEPAPSARAPGVRIAAKPQPPRRPQFEGGARALLESGAEKLAAAAREKCFDSPRDCVATLQRLQDAQARSR